MKEKITGAEALMRSLENEGVDVMFGYPGGAIMPTFDALYDLISASAPVIFSFIILYIES